MAGGLDLVFIAGLANKLNGTMVAAPAIQSPADLKHKNIAIQSIGGGVWMITQWVLEHWGLRVEAITFIQRSANKAAVVATVSR